MASTLAALNTTGKLVGVTLAEAVTDPDPEAPVPIFALVDAAARFV